jgi:hypothetical protein
VFLDLEEKQAFQSTIHHQKITINHQKIRKNPNKKQVRNHLKWLPTTSNKNCRLKNISST